MQSSLWGGSGYVKSAAKDLLSSMEFNMNMDNPVAQHSHQIRYDEEPIHGDSSIKIGYFWELSSDGDFGEYIMHHGGTSGTQN